MIKFCPDCGATGSVWDKRFEIDTCRCGNNDLRVLDDRVIDLEFQSLIEKTFTPFDRFVLESDAQTIEGEYNEDQAAQ